jgi:hypothetical protein
VFPRPTLTVRSPLAASSHGQALSPWYSSRRPGLEITRHQQGFTHVHPSGLPLARCSPGRNGGPSAFPGLRTPTDRTRRRTPERGSISNTDRELRTRHNGPPTCEVTRHTRPRVAREKLLYAFKPVLERGGRAAAAVPLCARSRSAPRARRGLARDTRIGPGCVAVSMASDHKHTLAAGPPSNDASPTSCTATSVEIDNGASRSRLDTQRRHQVRPPGRTGRRHCSLMCSESVQPFQKAQKSVASVGQSRVDWVIPEAAELVIKRLESSQSPEQNEPSAGHTGDTSLTMRQQALTNVGKSRHWSGCFLTLTRGTARTCRAYRPAGWRGRYRPS